jgi:hypothetical protein
MFLEVILKSQSENAPYRVYVNDELITERLYAITTLHPPRPTISNNLIVELENSTGYDVSVVSLTDKQVLLSDYNVKEKM